MYLYVAGVCFISMASAVQFAVVGLLHKNFSKERQCRNGKSASAAPRELLPELFSEVLPELFPEPDDGELDSAGHAHEADTCDVEIHTYTYTKLYYMYKIYNKYKNAFQANPFIRLFQISKIPYFV